MRPNALKTRLIFFRLVCVVLLIVSAAYYQTTSGAPRTNSDLDPIVLNAVFQDTLTYAGDDAPFRSAPGEPPKELLVSMTPVRYHFMRGNVLERTDESAWRDLSLQQNWSAQEAADHLQQRQDAMDEFAPFVPDDKRIRIHRPLTTVERKENPYDEMFNRPLQVSSPGYSRSRNLALVYTTIAWSAHGGYGIFILERKGGGWRVIVRQYTLYV